MKYNGILFTGKKTALTFGLSIALSSGLFAQANNADELIKTMKKEDITYVQLMAAMGKALNNIQEGIIGMNKVLVDRGINFVRTHPAPKKKPWVIMEKQNHEAFKSSLVYFDKKMDEDVLAIENAVAKKDWNQAMQELNVFQNTCMACHVTWKNEVSYIMK